MDLSIEIYPWFLFLFDSVFMHLCQTAEITSANNYNIAKVKFRDLFLIMWWTFDNTKLLTIYAQEEEEFQFSCYIWHFMCYVGLTCLKDHYLIDWTSCIVSFFFSLFWYTLFRKHRFLKELLWKYFLTCLIRSLCLRFTSVNLIVFAINNFHKQIHVKDSWP